MDNQVRVFLTQRELQVRQVLGYDFTDWTPAQVWVSIPAALQDVLHAQWIFPADKDGKYANPQMGSIERRPPTAGRDVEQPIIVPEGTKGLCQLILEYRLELPAMATGPSVANVTPIPLVRPIRAMVRNTHARFWTSAAIQLHAEEKAGWEPVSIPVSRRPGDAGRTAEEIEPQLEIVRAHV